MTLKRKNWIVALTVMVVFAQGITITASPILDISTSRRTAAVSPRLRVPASQQTAARFEPSEKSWKAADKRLKKMSVDEKVGQIIHVGINARFANQESAFFKDLKRHVVENKIGGVI